MIKRWISLLALSALALSGSAAAEAYKCRTADGRMEITNTPCPSGADTVKTVREENISEARRRQAEQEVERMREYLEKHDTAQRSEANSRNERQSREQAADSSNPPAPQRSVEDCLAELDRQALQPAQRAQMESACRNNPQQTVYAPAPVAIRVYGDHPVDTCIANIRALNLPPAERQQRIKECQNSAPSPLPRPKPVRKPTPNQDKPAPVPAPQTTLPCPPGSTNCWHR